MKKNNKGFMMAEVVIVASVIVVVVISLYTSFNGLYKGYNERLKFNSVDGLFFAKELENILIEELKLNDLAISIDNGTSYINLTTCPSSVGNVNMCTSLKSFYGVRNIYFTPYDVSDIKNNNSFSPILRDYLKIIANDVVDEENPKKYRLIIEMEDDSCTNLEIG